LHQVKFLIQTQLPKVNFITMKYLCILNFFKVYFGFMIINDLKKDFLIISELVTGITQSLKWSVNKRVTKARKFYPYQR